MGDLALGILARAIPEGQASVREALAVPECCLGCPSRKGGLCALLDAETLRTLSERSTHLTLPGDRLLADTARLSDFGVLLRGYIRRVHYGADGKRQITGWTLPGEAFSLRGGREPGELEAATEVEICRIRASSYEKALRESSRFRRAIHQLARARVDCIQQLTCALAALNPEQRVATLLVNLTRLMPWQPLPGGGGILTIELSRADIADFLGTTFETISRITRKFHRQGLIRIRDARHFEIANLGALARAGATASAGGHCHAPDAPTKRRA